MTKTDIANQLKVIAVRDRWAYEELVYDEKMKAWNKLISANPDNEPIEEKLWRRKRKQAVRLMATVQGMYGYLIKKYKTPKALLRMLQYLLRTQGTRRKTLCLY